MFKRRLSSLFALVKAGGGVSRIWVGWINRLDYLLGIMFFLPIFFFLSLWLFVVFYLELTWISSLKKIIADILQYLFVIVGILFVPLLVFGWRHLILVSIIVWKKYRIEFSFCSVLLIAALMSYYEVPFEVLPVVPSVVPPELSMVKKFVFTIGMGFAFMLAKIISDKEAFLRKVKWYDLDKALNSKSFNGRRIIIGYGCIGEELVKLFIQRERADKNWKNTRTFWDDKVYRISDFIVVEKNESKVPHVVGEYRDIGKIGYISSHNDGDNIVVAVLIADARSSQVLDFLMKGCVKTLTIASFDFRSNLDIIENLHRRDGGKSFQTPKMILPSRSYMERENYAQLLIDFKKNSHEIVKAYEHVGSKLAILIRVKFDCLNLDQSREKKILFFGNAFLDSTVEALLSKNLVEFKVGHWVVIDANAGRENFYGSEKGEVSKYFSKVNEQKLLKADRVTVWRPGFCVLKEAEFKTEFLPIPVISEFSSNFIAEFLKEWRPSVIVILHQRREDMEKVLNQILCHQRCNRTWTPNGENIYEIVVSVQGSCALSAAVKFLHGNFNIPYGVYSSTSTIARELNLLEKMS